MLRETKTENGWVRGIPAADPRITAFKGLPFAAPPVGDLRWRAPQPAADWEGVLDCARFGPISMQETPGLGGGFYDKEWHVDPDIPMDEDCLYLNVWTPAKAADEKLPVMVWIFGGGMACGYPAEMEFDGERIARRGVILVSVNYRLNAFGFLAHPELTKEAAAHGEIGLNFGLLDQQAGIRWVKRNIAAFGGDPENITVFGQSAGGRSTWMQVTSPANRGLFQKAIVQSGALDSGIATYPDLGQAETEGQDFLKDLGVHSIAEARALPAKEVLKKALACRPFRWGPIIDGKFLPVSPVKAFALHLENDVALMAGDTADEVRGLRPAPDAEAFRVKMAARYGDDWPEFDRLTNVKDEESLQRYYESPAFNTFEIGNHYAAAKRLECGGKPVYLYRFNPDIPGDNAGSFHSSDLWFVFETLAKCWRPFRGAHYDLARRMCNYWTNFAKNGDPNGPDSDGRPMPDWQPVSGSAWNVMMLGNEQFTAREAADPVLAFEMDRLDRKNR
ncbi:MAG: carboxylesterase family protein [Clostridia bacterium]|nr:carboxylesterase family protein [Clostridia bacterium]